MSIFSRLFKGQGSDDEKPEETGQAKGDGNPETAVTTEVAAAERARTHEPQKPVPSPAPPQAASPPSPPQAAPVAPPRPPMAPPRPDPSRPGSRPDWRGEASRAEQVRQPSPPAPPVSAPIAPPVSAPIAPSVSAPIAAPINPAPIVNASPSQGDPRRASAPAASETIADDEPTATHSAAYPPPPATGAAQTASSRGLPPPLPTRAGAGPNPAAPAIPAPAPTPRPTRTLPYFAAVRAPPPPEAEQAPVSRPGPPSREPSRRETSRPGPRGKPKSKRPPAQPASAPQQAAAPPAKRLSDPPPERRPEPPPPPVQPGEFADVHTLFAELAGNHMRPVRDLIIELQAGEARVDYIAICEPAIRSFRRSAEGMDLPDLCVALDAFTKHLESAARADGPTIAGELRAGLLASYQRLLELMPPAFQLDPERHHRDGVVLASLLQQVPGVARGAIDKMYAVGLNSVDMLAGAKTDEVAATTGLSRELAGRVLERVQAYRRENPGEPSRSSERDVLAQLVDQLKKLNTEYDRVSDAWSDDAAVRRRQLRVLRAEVAQRVIVIFARLGQVDRARDFERASFVKKVEMIEQYLKGTHA